MLIRSLAIAAFIFAMSPLAAQAAVSCTLDHPDRDVRRLVPESTTYRVRELIPFRHGPKDLMRVIERELQQGKLDKEYETAETPYTFYAVYKETTMLALILGINARVSNGPMQLFVVYDKNGKIRDVYVQKISADDATAFRSKFYREQYRKFSLDHLPEESEVLPPLRSPSAVTLRDHDAFRRAVKYSALLVRHLYNKFKE